MEFGKKRIMGAIFISYILSAVIFVLIYIINQNINSKIDTIRSNSHAQEMKQTQTIIVKIERKVESLQKQLNSLKRENMSLTKKVTRLSHLTPKVISTSTHHRPANVTVNTGVMLNFRTAPFLSATILGEFTPGTHLHWNGRLEKHDNYQWIEVATHHARVGWVAREYVH